MTDIFLLHRAMVIHPCVRVCTIALALLCACVITPAQQVKAQPLQSSSRLSAVPQAAPTGVQRASAAAQQPKDAKAPRSVDSIIAVVNEDPITQVELSNRYTFLQKPGGKNTYGADLTGQKLLDTLIDERIVLQAAREAGVRVSDEQLNSTLVDIARQEQLGSVEQLRQQVGVQGANWSEYVQAIRNAVTISLWREREIDSHVRATEAEITAALSEHAKSAGSSVKLNLAQILIALPENPTPQLVQAQQAKAQRVAALAASGEDFAKLALQYSDAVDKDKGGEIGLRNADRLPSLFVQAATPLRVGGISAIERSEAGFHILKLLAREVEASIKVTQTRVRHILLPVGPTLSEQQAKARLSAIRNQIELSQVTFAHAAREHSSDSSAAQGGELGWVFPGVFVAEFERAMNALRISEISAPVVSAFGVHLIEVTDRREVTLSPNEQRLHIAGQLRAKKIQEAFTSWLTEARNRAYIELRDPAAN